MRFDPDKAEEAFNDGYCGGVIDNHKEYEVEFREGVAQAKIDEDRSKQEKKGE